jgi:SAM-dependent methyltransferase
VNRQPKAGSGTKLDILAPLAPHAWLRYDAVKRTLPAGVGSVLEIGCGRGAFGARLAQRYVYLGIEPDEASYAVARQRIAAVGAGEVHNIASEALDDQTFDLVCAFEVLEHIEDDTAAVKDWATRVRAGGWLMLSVPADQHRYGSWDELVGHFRRYDPSDLTKLLANCGLSDIVVYRYNYPLGLLLEAARDVLGRRLAAKASPSVDERTAASGRTIQPSGGSLTGLLTRWGTAPFCVLQRLFPDRGSGLIVLARMSV